MIQVWIILVKLTLVPRCNKSRANGRIPRIISTPLLSTKMAAHL